MASRTGIKAGRAFIVIEAIDATGNVLNKIGVSLRQWGAKLANIGKDFLMKGLLSGLATALALNVGREFDAAMKKIEARSEGTAGEMGAIRKEAMVLGDTIGYTANETAKLMDQLAQLGFNRSQILAATKDVLALARAAGPGTEVDTTQAGELVGMMLNAYKLDKTSANVKMIVDDFALAANRGNYTLQEFAETMKNAATVGKEFGMPIEEVIALSSQLRDVSIQSESVGVAIRNIMLRLSNEGHRNKFNELLQKATGNTIEFVDAAGDLKPIPNLMFAIGQAMKNLGSSERANILNELIGEKAVVSAMVLSKIGNPFQNLLGELQNNAGFAEKAAETMNEGFDGAVRKMIGSLVKLSITLTDVLAPALIDLSQKILAGASTLSEWMVANRSIVVGIVMTIAYVTTLGISLILLGKTLQLVGLGFIILGSLVSGAAFVMKAFQSVLALQQVALLTYRGILLGVAVTSQVLQTATFALSASFLALRAAIRLLSIGLSMLWIATIYLSFGLIYAATGIRHFYMMSIVAPVLLGRMAGAFMATAAATRVFALSLLTATSPMTLLILGLTAIGALLYVNRKTIFDTLGTQIQWSQTNLQGLSNDFITFFSQTGMRAKELALTLYSTFRGVNDALALGDTQLAWDIGLIGLQLSFEMFVNDLMKTWRDFIVEFTDAFVGAYYGIQQMSSDFVSDMHKGNIDKILSGDINPAELMFGSKMADQMRTAYTDLMKMGFTPDQAKQQILKTINEVKVKNHNDIAEEAKAGLGLQPEGFQENIDARDAKIKALQQKLLFLFDDLAEMKGIDAAKRKELEAEMEEARRESSRGILTPPDFNIQGMINAAPAMTAPLKALDGLEKGSIEAAKAAYENAERIKNEQKKEENKIWQAQLQQLQGINSGIDALNLNLNIA